MAKISESNKYLMDKPTRDAVIRRNVVPSSIFEGIYHVSEADLKRAAAKPAPAPARKKR